jgi:hypothetical protein
MTNLDPNTDRMLIERPNRFNIVILTAIQNEDVKALLFPRDHEKLGKFTNIAVTSRITDVKQRTKTKWKNVIFVEVGTEPLESRLGELIYSIHADNGGLILGFTLGRLSRSSYARLVYVGLDDVFDLSRSDPRNHTRIYSWIRKYGANLISSRDQIASSAKKLKIGDWVILVNERLARQSEGRSVRLTRQQIDFLASLSAGPRDDFVQLSYAKLFKAPHAIVHNIKKKLGLDLPIFHDGHGQYYIRRQLHG